LQIFAECIACEVDRKVCNPGKIFVSYSPLTPIQNIRWLKRQSRQRIGHMPNSATRIRQAECRREVLRLQQRICKQSWPAQSPWHAAEKKYFKDWGGVTLIAVLNHNYHCNHTDGVLMCNFGTPEPFYYFASKTADRCYGVEFP
jgi:hypothetical protein